MQTVFGMLKNKLPRQSTPQQIPQQLSGNIRIANSNIVDLEIPVAPQSVISMVTAAVTANG